MFRLTADVLARPSVDLDNLAKPILDTLFTVDNVSPDVPTGAVRREGTWVIELRLEKLAVNSLNERGADIIVSARVQWVYDSKPNLIQNSSGPGGTP